MALLKDSIRFARRKTGCLTKAELTNEALLLDLLPAVLEELSQHGPMVSALPLVLAPLTTYYTPPSPKIIDVRLATNYRDIHGAYEIHDPLIIGRYTRHRYDRYSQPEIARIAFETECPNPTYLVDVVGGKIRVHPTPRHAHTIWLHVDEVWDLTYTMDTIIADGLVQQWDLDHRNTWSMVFLLDGDEVDEDELEVVRAGQVTKVALPFIPTAGSEIVISYLTPSVYDQLPATHHLAFKYYLAAQVAETVSLKRGKIKKFKTSVTEVTISVKELADAALRYRDLAYGYLDETESGTIIQGGVY